MLLNHSLEHWAGRSLIADTSDPAGAAQALYDAPYALLSHGIQADPIINYANRTAQQLFEMDWHCFTRLPSRLSAETALQSERDALLQRVTEQGFIDDYSGIRISASGKRFLIEQATVWNLIDAQGQYCGQAAMFSHWRMLRENI